MAVSAESAMCPVCGSVVGAAVQACPVCGTVIAAPAGSVEYSSPSGKSYSSAYAQSASGVPTTASLDAVSPESASIDDGRSASARVKLIGVFAIACAAIMAIVLVVVVLVGWDAVEGERYGDSSASSVNASDRAEASQDSAAASQDSAEPSSDAVAADSSAASSSSAVVAPTATEPVMDRDSSLGNSQGNLADGGISVQVDGGCLMVCGDSIIYQDYDQVGSGGYKLVYKGAPTAYLNYADGYLYFVMNAEDIDGTLRGDSIFRLNFSLDSLEIEGWPEAVWNDLDVEASVESPVCDFFYSDDVICCMAREKFGSTFWQWSTDGGIEYEAYASADARVLSLKSGTLRTLERGAYEYSGEFWGVTKLQAFTELCISLTVPIGLDSAIDCSAMDDDGNLILSTSEEGNGSLRKYSLTGGFEEYSGVKNAVHVACSGDSIVALSATGELTLTSALTGVTHDIGGQLTGEFQLYSPESCHLGIYGDWVFISDGSELFQVNSKTGEVNVLCVG